MTESSAVQILRNKRTEIELSIVNYEKRLEQARADLSHINAAIVIFEVSGERADLPPYVNIRLLFRHQEAMQLCKEALKAGPMNTRQLALHCMQAKGLDTTDRVLCKSIAARLIHPLTQQARRGTLDKIAKERGVCIWALPSS